nr:hypothetical protein [Mesorhizobium sp.]
MEGVKEASAARAAFVKAAADADILREDNYGRG